MKTKWFEGHGVMFYENEVNELRQRLDFLQDELNALRDKAAPDLLKENQSLRSELQKQKELNAEFVRLAIEIVTESGFPGCNYSCSSHWRIKLESLIKKYKES